MAKSDISELGRHKVLEKVALGMGLVGLILPLHADQEEPGWHRARKDEIVQIMSEATSHFDVVPPQVLEKIRENFYQSLVKVDHKFDFALPFRAATQWNNCFSWNGERKDWDLVEANLHLLRITGNSIMVIVKEKEESLQEDAAA